MKITGGELRDASETIVCQPTIVDIPARYDTGEPVVFSYSGLDALPVGDYTADAFAIDWEAEAS